MRKVGQGPESLDLASAALMTSRLDNEAAQQPNKRLRALGVPVTAEEANNTVITRESECGKCKLAQSNSSREGLPWEDRVPRLLTGLLQLLGWESRIPKPQSLSPRAQLPDANRRSWTLG